MPADRRTPHITSAKPIKTERTHEENQERAYIAASRRSDRSLEARIESARRASEIHKKRTGRALRVTEQDVVNEEMYEEEDDDLPTQYQRLNAHLTTSSMMFNQKLQNYIAAQHGVRNFFMSQFTNGYPPYAGQSQPVSGGQFSPTTNMMNPSMVPPQTFSPQQLFGPPSQPFSPQGQAQPHNYRQHPYTAANRPHPHQRSASMSDPHQVTTYGSSISQTNASASTPRVDSPHTIEARRMSLPHPPPDQLALPTRVGPSRPTLSRTSTSSQGIEQQTSSPSLAAMSPSTAPSAQGTAQFKQEHLSPTSYFPSMDSMDFPSNAHMANMLPLSLSLPPESQQLVGSALDSSDPRTTVFMNGSGNLPQFVPGTYTYNPNFSPKASRAGSMGINSMIPNGMSTPGAAHPGSLKIDTTVNSEDASPTTTTDNMYSTHSVYTPTGYDYSFFDPSSQNNDCNSLVNWDYLQDSQDV